MQKNTPNYTPNTHFGVLECPGGASGGQNLQGGVVGHFPPPMNFFQKFPDYVLVIRTYWGGLWEWFLTSPYYPPTLLRGWANFCVLGEITGFLFVSEIISMQIFLCNKIGTIWSLYSEIQKYLHFQPRVILIDPNIWNNFLFALKSLQTTYQ